MEVKESTGPLESTTQSAAPAAPAPAWDSAGTALPIARALFDPVQSAVELRDMLQQRLRTASVFLVCLSIGSLVFMPQMFLQKQWFVVGTHGLMIALNLVLAIAVFRRAELSLLQLRKVESALFTTVIAGYASYFCAYVGVEVIGQHVLPFQPGHLPQAAAVAFPCFAFMTAYGVYIPNTGRRCASMTTLMAVLSWLIAAGFVLAPTGGVGRSPQWFFLAAIGAFLVLGAAVAIQGSGYIDGLRRQAVAAQRLGYYDLKRKLGSGAMGDVFLAQHVLLRRPCALKLVDAESLDDPRHSARLEQALEKAARLTHANTIRIYDYGFAKEGVFYWTMEYMPGFNLSELVEKFGVVPPGRVVHLLRQMCRSLMEIHAGGLMHRDLKPGNVLLGERGGVHDVIKLLDVGLSHALGATGRAGSRSVHDSAYVAPELTGGTPNIDARCDIYSAGAVAYYLLSGKAPTGPSRSRFGRTARDGEAAAPLTRVAPSVPADLSAIVACCMDPDPTLRYADAQSFDAALAGCGSAFEWSYSAAADWWESKSNSQAQPAASAG